MPLSIVKKIVEEGAENVCPSIAFHVNDEPLLVKDLADRVAYANQLGFMDIFVTTNGQLLTKDKAIDLIEAGVTRFLFSIDAASPETYKLTRPGGNFELVMDNLNFLLDYRKANNLIIPSVRVSFVLSRLNYHERQMFIDKFSNHVDYVEIQGFSAYYDTNLDLIPLGASHVQDFTCNEPWRKAIIRPNGDVLPCCSFYGYEIVVGNILESTIKEIFNNEEYKRIRYETKNATYTQPACRACVDSFYVVR